MSQISEFFKESHTSFGVFYPLHYIVAVFPDAAKANLIMQGVSHAIGGEQVSTEHHVELARQGAAFLIVHCQSNAMKDAAWSKIREAEPVAAHYYTRGYVEHLKCSYSTAH